MNRAAWSPRVPATIRKRVQRVLPTLPALGGSGTPDCAVVSRQQGTVVSSLRREGQNPHDRTDVGARAVARRPLPVDGLPGRTWQDRMAVRERPRLACVGQQRLAWQLVSRMCVGEPAHGPPAEKERQPGADRGVICAVIRLGNGAGKNNVCDEETGLHYNRHRYYDPNSVRPPSKDSTESFDRLKNFYAPRQARRAPDTATTNRAA